jgi:hypothetical protein
VRLVQAGHWLVGAVPRLGRSHGLHRSGETENSTKLKPAARRGGCDCLLC